MASKVSLYDWKLERSLLSNNYRLLIPMLPSIERGKLTVDFPEDMSLPMLPDQYQTISLSGATVQMEYCGISEAIVLLKEEYAIGTVTAKIIQPRPK